VLFLARREGLAVIGAFGSDVAGRPLSEVARGMTLAGDEKSALSDVLGDGQLRAMRFDEARLPALLTKMLGPPRTGQCAVFPVMGGQRVIALVYADNGKSERPIEELDLLELAASQAGLAFENELLRRQATHH
jgi:GAF domain-containing protein